MDYLNLIEDKQSELAAMFARMDGDAAMFHSKPYEMKSITRRSISEDAMTREAAGAQQSTVSGERGVNEEYLTMEEAVGEMRGEMETEQTKNSAEREMKSPKEEAGQNPNN